MTMLLYSYTSTPAVADGVVDRRARPEEAAVDLRDAAGADEQADVDVGELAAEPEVALLLPDHLADQRRGPALEVVAVVDEVVAVGDVARDGVARRHQPRRQRALLVVADVRAKAVGIDGQIRRLTPG